MNWIEITDNTDLNALKETSNAKPVMVFKHSTRCSVSSMVLNRLERSWSTEEAMDIQPYYLDLIRNRELSNRIAEVFEVQHQSPQVLIIRDGKVVYNNSHTNISFDNIKAASRQN
ncbi:MAG: bacillithiol system redox-active protein YtxJ [Fulvivirga sp.]